MHKTSEFLGIVLCLTAYILQKLLPFKLFREWLSFEDSLAIISRQNIIGCVLIASAAIMIYCTQRELSKYDQPHQPGLPTTRLVKTGVFRYSRNPTYAAIIILLQPGIALMTSSEWLLILWPGSFLLFWIAMVQEEERYLEQKFGKEWKQYCYKTRRWI